MINIHKYFGLTGVDESEPPFACKLGKAFRFFSIVVIYTIAFQWEMNRVSAISAELNAILNSAVLLFFVIETIALTLIVKEKLLFLKQNWMNALIITSGLVIVVLGLYSYLSVCLQYLRPVLAVYLLTPWLDACWKSLSDNRLGTTLITAMFVMFLSGIFIAGLDPAIHTVSDGVWWAWVTMSTVGYGDVVPVSAVGRLFAAGLILMGLGMFAIITANFSAIFVQRGVRETVVEVKKEGEEIRQLLEQIHAVRKQEDVIENALKSVIDRLERLEKGLVTGERPIQK